MSTDSTAISLPPLCDVCRRSLTCRAANRIEPDFPHCNRTFRNLSTQRVRNFVDFWFDGQQTPPQAEAMLQHLLPRFAVDRQHTSDIFEVSMSIEHESINFARFSYALRDFQAAPEATAQWALTFGRCFGPFVGDVFQQLLKRVRHPCVEQILVGAAFDAPGQWRAKLYVQFKHDAGAEALKLAGVLTGIPALAKRAPPHALHLLGIDITEKGISGAKLYFMIPRVGLEAPLWGESRSLFKRVLPKPGQAFENVLSIYRVDSPDGDGLRHPTDVDLHLGENHLRWSDFAKFPEFDGMANEIAIYENAKQTFDITERRLSVSVTSQPRLSLYYVLASREPVSMSVRSPSAANRK